MSFTEPEWGIVKMIKILILTDDELKWGRFIRHIMIIDKMWEFDQCFHLENQMFHFYIRSSFPESMRGATFAHVIEDKKISAEDFCHLILPTIKQKVTQYGSRTILGE